MVTPVTSLEELAELLERATEAKDIFPGDPTVEYRRLAKLCHPDLFSPGPRQDQAQRVFARLTAWFERATAEALPAVIASPRQAYTVLQRIAEGDVADIYTAVADSTHYVLKICRANGGDSLLVAEYRCLQSLAKLSGDRRYRQYIPNPVESFVATGEFSGRQVNVFTFREGFHTLKAISDRYPSGLDARHLAWLFKRLLVVAGFARQGGIVHGAILPPHVLVHAENHGIQLVDWIGAVKPGHRLRIVPTRYRDWYPPEVLNREPATSATDIYLAAKCLVYAAGGDPVTEQWPDSVPSEMRQFVSTCLYSSPRMRPQDAWQLHEEFDELLRRLFGPPKYHPLVMA
jgi:hypothetical protein